MRQTLPKNRCPPHFKETSFDWRLAAILLDRFANKQIPYVLIGSVAVELLRPGLLDREPTDLDLMLPNDLTVLTKWVRAVSDLGFQVLSWGEPVQLPLPFSRLRGRYYMRAIKQRPCGGLFTMDATYESPVFAFEEAWSERLCVRTWNIAEPLHLCRLLEARGNSRDLYLIGKLRNIAHVGTLQGKHWDRVVFG